MKRLLLIVLSLAALCGCSGDDDSADKVYEVGDVYFGNGKSGIVFWVTDDGRHGKIVSADYGYCQWANIDVEAGQLDVFDEDDGMNNMAKIREVDGWHEKFPAFAWCADKGEDWYLPARNELSTLMKSGALYDRTITLWASTGFILSDGEFCARTVVIHYDNVVRDDRYSVCDVKYYVRAIAAF